jgi:iron complex outermembrane receptor protein
MNLRNPIVQRSIAQIISGVAVIAATAPALAQDKLEEVTVTGTRIAKPDLTSNSPISTISAETLDQLNTVNLETQLRQLPQFLPGATEYINNGNPGAATVNLRGLGSNRTLVLMDGKRLPPFGLSGAVDINLIPAAIIERVDVVTGGASAVYGSDAVAGVVNFITKQNFEGVQIDADASQYGKGDGLTQSFALSAGTSFADDRGSALLSFGYTKRDPVLQGDRAYSTWFQSAVDGFQTSDGACGTYFYQYPSSITDPARRGGSSNAAATRISAFRNVVNPCTGNFSLTSRYFTPDGQYLSSAATGATSFGPNRVFNYNPYNYFQVPQERWQALATLSYQVNDSAEVYGRLFAVRSSIPTQLAPSAYFGGSTQSFKLNLDNPFLSAAQRTALISVYNVEAAVLGTHGVYNPAAAAGTQLVGVTGIRRRMIELGPRIGVSDTDTMQFTGGVRGDIGSTGWNYDVSAQYGRVSNFSGTQKDVSIVRAQNALLAIAGPGGTPVCISGGACAPINLFTGNGALDPNTGIAATGSISKAALDYVEAAYYSNLVNEAKNISASVSGELGALKSPAAESALGLAFGAEWNETNSDYRPDDLTRFGGAMGQGGNSPPIKGRLSSSELFFEAYMPLVEGRTGVESLALEAGLRMSDTNLSGSFEAWKAGLEYEPISGLRFRTMLQRAVRAPNIGEQFSPFSYGLTEIRSDPCAGSAPSTNAALRAKCIAQGAPAAQIGSINNPAAQQAASISSGAVAAGVKLKPETADTFTVGLQVTPDSMPGFIASIDYYKIDLEDGIGSYGAQEVIDNCFNNNISSFCSLVKRNGLGELEGDGFGIILDTRNLAKLKAEGIDYAVSYTTDFSDVKVNIGIAGTHTLKNSFKSSPASPEIECTGEYGDTCGNPLSQDRVNLNLSGTWRAFTASVLVRYLSAVQATARVDDPEQTGRSVYTIEEIPAFSYVDLSFQYNWNDALKVTLAAQNLLDKDPTIVGQIPGANTSMNAYADVYDPLGTKFSLGLTYKF